MHLLFSYRTQGIGRQYLNIRVIPALCAKAGMPTADVRGNITSHRARSTIAGQLHNAKEPMTLFELQAWLGQLGGATELGVASLTIGAVISAVSLVLEGHQGWREAGSGAAELMLRSLGIALDEARRIAAADLPALPLD
ncbi:hypothetical protein ACFYXQ_29745 [Nocardia jiangxiensis]|uniref:Uncharacterized protein n=1 Tax=Nocardia jiangxiensis TaxID=282685 RepID=A0ABW6S6U2_9NOCA